MYTCCRWYLQYKVEDLQEVHPLILCFFQHGMYPASIPALFTLASRPI